MKTVKIQWALTADGHSLSRCSKSGAQQHSSRAVGQACFLADNLEIWGPPNTDLNL